MKKNISINISGIIFHIEEDGYETLRKYLDSISKYFSSFEDSSEIMADIESRMAEIFLSKLNEGKQVITADDVNSLITTMGSVKDFKAAEDQDFESKESASFQHQQSAYEYVAPKQLLRDKQRKILGGVCSGIGSYLNVDPIWIRLAFAFTVFFYGITLLVYIIMWIIVPGSYDLPEPVVHKKMFRDADRKVLGGVAGGLASYLGIDIIAVRVLFIVFTVTGGIGIFVYIVLWLILTEAKTLTDKMQMQGEPVTLSNIESTIKKNQNLNSDENESSLTKILLLPFRALAAVLNVFAKLLIPIVEIFRVAIGIFIMIVGIALVLALVVSGSVLFGLLSGTSLPFWAPEFNNGIPVEILQGTFPTFTILAAFTVVAIPAIFIMLLGISTMAKRIVFSATIGWSLFVLFFLSIAVLGMSVPRIVYAFKENGEYRIENTYQPNGKTVLLALKETGLDGYQVTELNLRGYDGKGFKLVQTFEAQGTTKSDAIANAQMIEYHVDFKDSVITFDSNIQFKKDAKFRAQHLNMTLYIPFDFPFVMNEDVSHFVSQYIEDDNKDGNTWKMTTNGLTCITCTNEQEGRNYNSPHNDLSDFDAVDVDGAVDLTITQGDIYAVELNGSEKEKEKYDIYRRGNTLVIDFKNEDKFSWRNNFKIEEMHINITMPELERLEAKGAGKINFNGFDSDDLEIEILGALNVHGTTNTKNLTVSVSGASSLELEGHGATMQATIQGASKLKAYDFEVENASVNVHGVSRANVNVTQTLEMREDVVSKINYKGHPEIVKHD